MSKQTPSSSKSKHGEILKLIFYWSLALIPLGWGVAMTMMKALVLFYR